jgi:hypothetical protein
MTPVCFLWLAIERRRGAGAGWWAGWTATFWPQGWLWIAGGALITSVRFGISRKPVASGRIKSETLGVIAGAGASLLLAVLADQVLKHSGPFPDPEGFAVRSADLGFLFSPWIACPFLAVAAYALCTTPSILLFTAPAITFCLARADRDPSFALPLLPWLLLAIATAASRGRFGGPPSGGRDASQKPR